MESFGGVWVDCLRRFFSFLKSFDLRIKRKTGTQINADLLGLIRSEVQEEQLFSHEPDPNKS